MRLRALLIPAFLLSACRPYEIPAENVTGEFKPLVEQILAAWVSLDIRQVEPFYTRNPGDIFFDVSPLKYVGWEAYSSAAEAMHRQAKSASFQIHPDFRATRRGGLAWVSYTFTAGMEMKDGQKFSNVVRATQVFAKQRSERWLVIHDHFSVPAQEQNQ